MRDKVYTYDNLMYNGRLGNQLWQIAATACAAEQNGGIARFNPAWEYRPYFNVPDELFGDYNASCKKVDGGTDYFQEYHYFEPIAEKVREWFSPSAGAMVPLALKWAEYKTDGRTCAIHVRRGDYLKHPNHFPIMTARYFNAAVEAVDADQFLVFSDDIDWCRNNVEYLGLTGRDYRFVTGVIRPVEVSDRVGEPMDWLDLFTIAMCDEHIISNSTFSWWGAYLSNNPSPIYPDKWFGRAVPNWNRWELAIPAGWRKFPC